MCDKIAIYAYILKIVKNDPLLKCICSGALWQGSSTEN